MVLDWTYFYFSLDFYRKGVYNITMRRLTVCLLFVVLFSFGCASQQFHFSGLHPELAARLRCAYNDVRGFDESYEYLTYILSDKGYNAYLLKNGTIGVTSDFAAILTNDEMRLIICHEIAHKKLNHYQKKTTVSYATSAAFLVAGFIIPGAGYLDMIVNPITSGGFNKHQEIDADLAAVDYCYNALHISPETYVSFLQKFKAHAIDGGGLFQEHPSFDDRISAVKKKFSI